MSAILTADIHLNSKPSEEYRWGLFDWLVTQKADELIIAGDITDQKDHHPAKLVNRLFDAVMNLEQHFRIIFIRGNHDYYDINHPFFKFLGSSSDIQFITEPTTLKLSIGSAFFVPAGLKWDFKIPKADYLFTHATFSGAKVENGQTLTGVDPKVLDGFAGKVYSGDIHVPQTLNRGRIEYVGSPYHTRFSDDFEPRLLYLANDGAATDLHFPAPRKHTFHITKPDDLRQEKASPGDYVKVRCLLRRAEYDKWRGYHADIREIAKERGWQLFGAEPVAIELTQPKTENAISEMVVQPTELVAAYAKQQKAGEDYLKAGLDILAEHR